MSDTLDIVPYDYLILSYPPGVSLSELRRLGKLSERQNVLLDLEIGRWMREMHDRIQNDWFGLPKPTPPASAAPPLLPSIPGLSSLGFGQQGADDDEPSYSWQETFTSLLESMLSAAEARGLVSSASCGALRQPLGRAIGSFLFDDCEVPSLLTFLADAGSVFVHVPAEGAEPTITSLLPPTFALYGDPLLETFFLASGPEDGALPGPAPSQALLEGYGGSPIVFRRQKTKRVWYDVFLALVVLLAARGAAVGGPEVERLLDWARRRLEECVDILKDAPCY
ncbi:uncharacterized protein PHACADRAFT_259168 [Phanerochaete carnosa HHB-10118-sp]|uniref:Uncharacterized protein n=1 Tax=Phanerochaete carnosa (strain HHB-10118-sp) TaxID=650164 RepID=K5W1L2_PHACS|nr:uncharacterized protein PHACADRAFT_259168 [Phanerochaete carnosa HHB-10118-sp]EKM53000.1 hypothetical protein PHACADRAFT_259168 [Phanerochaete carnosa HHB-10118-sp]